MASAKQAYRPMVRSGRITTPASPGMILPKVTKADMVAEVLRREISTGRLPAGADLPQEAEILAHFKVSRPPVREALRMLESEGLIRITRGQRGGAKVAKPELAPVTRSFGVYLQREGATMDDLFTSLAACEVIALREVAERRDPAVLVELAQAATAQEFYVDDRQSYNRYEVKFRKIFIDACTNKIIRALGTMLTDVYGRHMAAVSAKIPPLDVQRERLIRGVSTKQKLVGLLAGGQADAAGRAWQDYLRLFNKLTAEFTGPKAPVEYYSLTETAVAAPDKPAKRAGGKGRPGA